MNPFAALLVLLVLGCTPPKPPAAVTISVDTTKVQHEVRPEFLSFAIDSSQVFGGHWWEGSLEMKDGLGAVKVAPFDFSREKLQKLAKALAPAYLRIGGSEADHVFYAVGEQNKIKAPPPGYKNILTESMWQDMMAFTEATNLKMFFTANGGPTERDDQGNWQPANLLTLLKYANGRGDTVPVWELGNETSAYWFIHGLGHAVDGATYASDFLRFSNTVNQFFPGTVVTGPASAYWPIVYEPLGFLFGVTDSFIANVPPDQLKALTWHYYPTQSERCPIAVRGASVERFEDPHTYDEILNILAAVKEPMADYQQTAELWLGETGPAQCGGAPGLSDRFLSGLWWLDQLGLMAREQVAVVVRQTLVGSDYGMLDTETLDPRPDYWNSVAWRRLMGHKVLQVDSSTDSPYIRAYAHCDPTKKGRLTLLLINLADQAVGVQLEGLKVDRVFEFEPDAKLGKRLTVSGTPLEFPKVDPATFENLGQAWFSPNVNLPGLRYLFVQGSVPGDGAACQ